MSVHNMYAQIVLATKKFHFFFFFLFLYLCINPDNSFKWGSWLYAAKRYWFQFYPIYLEQKIAKTFKPFNMSDSADLFGFRVFKPLQYVWKFPKFSEQLKVFSVLFSV